VIFDVPTSWMDAGRVSKDDRAVRFETYQDFARRYRWRLRGRDRQIIADSARSYASSEDAWRAAVIAKAEASLASMERKVE
jgi:uncharacterized protein YegP (UPF0339 family)